jgi:hypothetical protein
MKFTHFIPDVDADTSFLPVTAKSEIPQWYKDGEVEYFDEVTKSPNPGIKKCIPILDSLTTGYLLKTSVNIYIKKRNNGTTAIDYDLDMNTSTPVGVRADAMGATIPRPAGHKREQLTWTSHWSWKTPRGYSLLITHPLNRWDLPFTTMAGIVDSDKYHGSGNIPFFLKEEFEGLIPKGTPYAQVIPIKRAEWTTVFDPALTGAALNTGIDGSKGGYKKNFWKKKTYLIGEKNDK